MPRIDLIDIDSKYQNEINKITQNFPLYCDFQFSNLLSWSSHKSPTKFAIINNNLVIQIKEYSTEKSIYMFMGNNDVTKTIKMLLDQGITLERVPGEVINTINSSSEKENFIIEEDSNNDDYILDLAMVANLKGNHLKSKRHEVNRFIREFNNSYVALLTPNYNEVVPLLETFFEDIAREKNETFDLLADEFEAVEKLIRYQHLFEIHIVGVYLGSKMIGFTINELYSKQNKDIALGCFGKGLRYYTGIFAYLEFVTARDLIKRNIKFLNLEEDMGMQGLRESKQLWKPARILKKYKISNALLKH